MEAPDIRCIMKPNRGKNKYAFHQDWVVKLYDTHTELSWRYVTVHGNTITFKHGYSWDGPSGPAYDNPETLVPSAIHDALYGYLYDHGGTRRQRKLADREYRLQLVDHGYPSWRATAHYVALRAFGWWAARMAPWK
jgi:hypothetical protein